MNKAKIPNYFYKSDLSKPILRNVGDLINELKKLPKDLHLEGCSLTVYNFNTGPCLAIDDED